MAASDSTGQATDQPAGKVAAPDSTPQAVAPPPDRIRVWPEVPLPANLPRALPRDSLARAGYRPLAGRWFLMLEAGYKRNLTDFRDFFTDMGMFGITWGRMVGRLMPFFAMEVGFGDLKDDFEDLAGDGRSNTYAFSAGLLARQPLSRRTSFYVSGAYGYFIRSLQWGGFFYNPYYGTYTEGFVLEQQDWGYALRAGVQIQRASRKKPRFLDIGIGLHSTPAEEWFYFDETHQFRATKRDTWLILSFRFGEGI